jgi:hypothetical protein
MLVSSCSSGCSAGRSGAAAASGERGSRRRAERWSTAACLKSPAASGAPPAPPGPGPAPEGPAAPSPLARLAGLGIAAGGRLPARSSVWAIWAERRARGGFGVLVEADESVARCGCVWCVAGAAVAMGGYGGAGRARRRLAQRRAGPAPRAAPAGPPPASGRVAPPVPPTRAAPRRAIVRAAPSWALATRCHQAPPPPGF